MNIGQAKQDIKDTVRLYLKKDEFGEYRIPVVRQRPIFLVGAPGIGKTAIMEQIAQELQIALVSYSMTHHTRQSALGLPVICHREYEGKEYDVSEYTMSEIIASVYEVMRESGLKEGILFLDEINCVSETLAPSMLQFLQYKVFGGHRVPEGWVIVTAGNPKEYNRSAREFDVVTLDRLKVLCVEADYEAWKRYAEQGGLHRAVLNYLELKKQDFYVMEMTAKGRAYVTARGWEDLSQMLFLYEEESLPVTEELVGQYLGHERVIREFMAYYDLYCKYQKDYHIGAILHGDASEEMRKKAAGAPFDERISLLGMLTDSMDGMLRECMEKADYLENLMQVLKNVKRQMGVVPEAGRGHQENEAVSEAGRGQQEAVSKTVCGQHEHEAVSEAGRGQQEAVSKTVRGQHEQSAVSETLRGQQEQNTAPAGNVPQARGRISADEALSVQITARERLLDSLSAANALSPADQRMHKRVLAFLREQKRSLLLAGERTPFGDGAAPGTLSSSGDGVTLGTLSSSGDGATPGTPFSLGDGAALKNWHPFGKGENANADSAEGEGQFAALRRAFAQETASVKEETAQAKQCLHHLFSFVEQVFADGNELLLLVTHMTATDCCAGFVARFGCEEYERHSGELMLSERREALLQEMQELEP